LQIKDQFAFYAYITAGSLGHSTVV